MALDEANSRVSDMRDQQARADAGSGATGSNMEELRREMKAREDDLNLAATALKKSEAKALKLADQMAELDEREEEVEEERALRQNSEARVQKLEAALVKASKMQRAEAARVEDLESTLESIGTDSAALNRIRELEEQLAHADREVDEAQEYIKKLERVEDRASVADQISELEQQLTQAEGDVDEAQTQMKALQEDNDAAREALSTADEEIEELRRQLEEPPNALAGARAPLDPTDGMSLIAALRENRERLSEFEHMIPDKLASSLEGPEFTKHCEEWFGDLDADKNGVLSAEELFPVIEHLLREEEIEVTKEHCTEFTEAFDENGDGVIQHDEFESYCRFQVIALYLHNHPDHEGLAVSRAGVNEGGQARTRELEERVRELEEEVSQAGSALAATLTNEGGVDLLGAEARAAAEDRIRELETHLAGADTELEEQRSYIKDAHAGESFFNQY